MFENLLNRNFFLLWQGQLVSNLGSQAFLIAAMYWTMQATGSASLMGILMMASALPTVLLGPVGGTFADWYSRRTIIIAADLLSGICVLSLAILFFLNLPANLTVIGVFSAVIVLGIVKAFFQPAITAAIPDIVRKDKVAAANSMTNFSVQASTLLGQGLGGILYRMVGAGTLFIVDGISYLISAVSESFIDLPVCKRQERGSFSQTLTDFVRDTLDGLKYVLQQTGMRNLLLISSVINFLLMPIFVLLPFYVDLTIAKGVEWYGFLLAAISAGAVLGYIIAGSIEVRGEKRSHLIIAAFFGVSAALAAASIVANGYVALFVFLLVGILSGLINIYVLTIFQINTPTGLRGRVMSLVITLSGGIAPLGMIIGGLAGDLTNKNIPLIYALCGGIAAVFTLIAALNREFRAFLAEEPK